MSPSDPSTRWTGAHGGQAFFAYSTNYLVDVENAVIVDLEATTAIRQAEMLAAKRMIERSLERFDLYPSRLLGDSGYGSAEMLGWLVTSIRLSRTLHCSIGRPARLGPSRATTSPMTTQVTSTAVPTARFSPRLERW
ncbi:hypothetical protein ACVIGB_009052 [Bradyrhizobium sp. USDA 4341]